jgi:thiol-disulfide isomerase/thioredoxin
MNVDGVRRLMWCGVLLTAAWPCRPASAAEPSSDVTDAERNAPDVADRAQAAQPMVFILRDRTIRAELRLSTDQAAAVDKALGEVDYPLWCVRDARDDDTQVKRARAYDHLEKMLDATLPPLQRRRFDGIVLRTYGWPGVLLPRFVEQLKPTAEQQSGIRELLKPAENERPESDGETLSADKQRQIRSVLTESQRHQLSQLLGGSSPAVTLRRRYCRAPEFAAIAEWINTEPLDRAKLTGKVTAVHFWAFGCINCVRNLPHYQMWQQKYADKGLVIVGIHTPETAAERLAESVRAKVAENEMRYPVAIDASAKTWNAWSNRWWPSVYLVDKQGYVRYWWTGELNWQGAQGEEFLRSKIEELLAERD